MRCWSRRPTSAGSGSPAGLARAIAPAEGLPVRLGWGADAPSRGRGRGLMRRDGGWWALILPAFLLMTLFYVAPIVQVLAISFTEPQPGLGNYERLFTSESVQRVIGTTLRICLATTVLALLLGYVLAYRIALASERARRWWILAVLVPLWISVLVAPSPG
jgi:ABC-type spermidine/putrescine transport system permease subunit I